MSELTCKEAERKLPKYLNENISDEDALELIEHIENCPECKEELTIQHMVSVGLNNLDEIIDLNVDYELGKRKREAVRRIHKKDITERVYLGILFVGVTTAFLAGLLILL